MSHRVEEAQGCTHAEGPGRSGRSSRKSWICSHWRRFEPRRRAAGGVGGGFPREAGAAKLEAPPSRGDRTAHKGADMPAPGLPMV